MPLGARLVDAYRKFLLQRHGKGEIVFGFSVKRLSFYVPVRAKLNALHGWIPTPCPHNRLFGIGKQREGKAPALVPIVLIFAGQNVIAICPELYPERYVTGEGTGKGEAVRGFEIVLASCYGILFHGLDFFNHIPKIGYI